mmetsp:Transcript_32380/g.52362  ORF Transcript_32380/g.52362 Transcript_32380/m.52362 type:complete len:358 (-) Transcript_32380:483-1556(-)|eukprot:CAMPEP_0184661976 /NCGR_PEP_ID=MMETSP0308-20130426/41032_1 /TAXON_ID=38269 /ORGANISM="Gloeochaete witrockiana, Strain SAG 46.84" /LENGTH=357 /DNA_ID=CAMNT_0027103669 /DNA_START=21 /DNA_END=1094 /DNA_ORIENTATION=-
MNISQFFGSKGVRTFLKVYVLLVAVHIIVKSASIKDSLRISDKSSVPSAVSLQAVPACKEQAPLAATQCPPREDCLVTLVLPVVESDLKRLKLLDKSFNRFFNFSRVCDLYLITRPDQMKKIAAIARTLLIYNKVNIRIVNEQDVIPQLKNVDIMGWLRQQLLKLAVSEMIITEYYMCMDCDILSVKHCGVDQLFEDGKALTNMEHKDHLGVTAPDWWEGSEKTLGMKIPETETMRFGVSPAILSTKVMQQMRIHLEDTWKKPWKQHLVDRVWDSYTEYCMYGVFAQATGMFDKYHKSTENMVYKEYRLNIWWVHMFDTWDVPAVFDPNTPGCFVVVQSNTKIDADKTAEKVLKYIE